MSTAVDIRDVRRPRCARTAGTSRPVATQGTLPSARELAALIVSVVAALVATASVWWARSSAHAAQRSARAAERAAAAEEIAAKAASESLAWERDGRDAAARRDREEQAAPRFTVAPFVVLADGRGMTALKNASVAGALLRSATLNHPAGSDPAALDPPSPARVAPGHEAPLGWPVLDRAALDRAELELCVLYDAGDSAYEAEARFQLLPDGVDAEGALLWCPGTSEVTRLT